ncbi:MAG: hypothetical protein V2J65_06370 [Desulfobacteraceae bacterium]|nr:hypothetical protein [Desulfobacteraceae bacterium]
MSGMTGDCHVPFCGGLGVRSPWATRLFIPLTTVINPLYLSLSAAIHSTFQFDSEALSSTLYSRHLNRYLSPSFEWASI